MTEAIENALQALRNLSGQVDAELQQAKETLKAVNRDIEAGKVMAAQLQDMTKTYQTKLIELTELEKKIAQKNEEYGAIYAEVTTVRRQLQERLAI